MKQATKQLQTLTFLRLATKAKDGANGILYRHTWATGFQEIIFPSQRAANLFIKDLN